jgi:hypothetical protein
MLQCEWQTVRETKLGEPPDRGCGAKRRENRARDLK